jgi:rRNA maturation RNase YbeY
MAGKLNSKQLIHFYFEKVEFSLKNRTQLKRFIGELIAEEKKKIDNLNYIFCNDKVLLEINRRYLNHNFYTDIITFDLSASSKEILADIYISVDRVKENSRDLKMTIQKELQRVMFHGLLHLCGYNDKTENQKKLIRRKEDHYLNLYFKRFT